MIDIYEIFATTNLEKPGRDIIERRINAFDEYFNGNKDFSSFSELIRYIFSLPTTGDSIETFTSLLVKVDPTISQPPKPYFIKTHCMLALLYFIDQHLDSTGILVALAILCCYCNGLRKKPDRINFIELSERLLIEGSLLRRSVKSITPIDMSFAIKDEFLSTAINDPQIINTPDFPKNIQSYLNKLSINQTKYSKNINNLLQVVNRNFEIKSEESDILWWIFNISKKGKNQKWPFPGIQNAGLYISKELAEIIKVLPGPLSVEELITDALQTTEDTNKNGTFDSFISNLSNDAINSVFSNISTQITNLTPVLFTINLRINGLKNKPLERFKENSINKEYKISTRNITYQLYREQIFLKALEEFGFSSKN